MADVQWTALVKIRVHCRPQVAKKSVADGAGLECAGNPQPLHGKDLPFVCSLPSLRLESRVCIKCDIW